MYILIIMLLSSSTIDHVEYSTQQSCENARVFLLKHQQLKNRNVFAECIQK